MLFTFGSTIRAPCLVERSTGRLQNVSIASFLPPTGATPAIFVLEGEMLFTFGRTICAPFFIGRSVGRFQKRLFGRATRVQSYTLNSGQHARRFHFFCRAERLPV